MATLSEDLQLSKSTLEEFKKITERVLRYMPAVINEEFTYGDYLLCSSTTAGMRKTIRPYNFNLFLKDLNEFNKNYHTFLSLTEKLKKGERHFLNTDYNIVDKVIYTIQQAIGIGCDLLVEQNSARKQVGNRFEELIRALFKEMGISIKKVVLSIPYSTDDGEKHYRCETDIIISPYKTVKSSSKDIDKREIIVSLKTTTKDRMPKIFIDKILIERFLGHSVKMIGISQNDIQRSENKNGLKISYTFVSNLFMVYTKFLAELDGYYYLDIPKRAKSSPFNNYIFPFSKFIINDIWELLRP